MIKIHGRERNGTQTFECLQFNDERNRGVKLSEMSMHFVGPMFVHWMPMIISLFNILISNRYDVIDHSCTYNCAKDYQSDYRTVCKSSINTENANTVQHYDASV